MRERGIYRLPDGKRYVAIGSPFTGYLLHREAEGLSAETCYRVNARGQVLDAVSLKQIFPKGSLVDTGESYAKVKKATKKCR
jgi:hypothetical protein